MYFSSQPKRKTLVNQQQAMFQSPCIICQNPATKIGLCTTCIEQWPVNISPCIVCGEPETLAVNQICGRCLSDPPDFDSCLTGALYDPVTAFLVKRLKYNGQLSIAPLLADMFHHQHSSVELPEALIPMPLHWVRTWRRGFNQAGLIANSLSRQYGIPCWAKGITRTRRTQALEGKTKIERQKILRGVFKVTTVPFAHVAIVDDVMTTGASAESLALALKTSGVERVDIWVMTRTPKNH